MQCIDVLRNDELGIIADDCVGESGIAGGGHKGSVGGGSVGDCQPPSSSLGYTSDELVVITK